MISIRCVGGEYDGVVREAPADINPHHLLHQMTEAGLGWEISFSRATPEEVIRWGGADLMARAVRAVRAGRAVSFLGVEYTEIDRLQAFEDAIVGSGYCVRVAQDDDRGMVVDIVQPE